MNEKSLNAQDNWWGAADGPGGVGPGSGDEVGEHVDYDPWLLGAVSVVAVPDQEKIYIPHTTTLRSTTAAVAETQGITLSNRINFQNWLNLDDTLDVTLTDGQGWLLSPLSLTVPLTEELGASALVSFTVPAGTPLDTTDTVTVTAASQSDPTDRFTTTFQIVVTRVADLEVKMSGPDLLVDLTPFSYTITVSILRPWRSTLVKPINVRDGAVVVITCIDGR